MQILVNTDSNVAASDKLVGRINAELESELSRFSEQITRVEVHVGDEAAGRSDGMDIRCVIEARPAGQPPVVARDQAGTAEEACSGAVQKLRSLLDSKYGKTDHRKGGDSIRHLPVDEGLI